MSSALPYPAQKEVHAQLALRDSLPAHAPLAHDFLSSMNPTVSPTQRTAQDIASYLNNAPSPVNQTGQTGYSTFATQQALIQALLASAKHNSAHQNPYPFDTFNQLNNNNMMPSSSQPPLWTQESSVQQQQPSSSFNLAQYQAYLDFHALRFSPAYTNYKQQQQNQFNSNQQQYAQSATLVYPALPFVGATGDGQGSLHSTSSSASASSHSTAESPSLPELGQDFIYDPAFDLSGGANDFSDTSPYLQPAHVHSAPFEYPKVGGATFNPVQQQQLYYQHALAQQQQQQQASLGPDSPLTTSPSSVNSTASPYAFNQLGDSSFSTSGSEHDFHSAAVSRQAAGSSSSSTASVGSHNGDGEPEKKKHVCDICHRGFARAFNLKSHMHTHAPQRFKPFNCPAVGCSRSFSRSHDMERHRSGIHQEGPLAAKAGLIPEDSPAAAPGVKASSVKKRSSALRGVSNAA